MIIFDAPQLVWMREKFKAVFPLASAGGRSGGRSDAVLLAVRPPPGKPAKFADFAKLAKPQGKTLLNSNDLRNSKSDCKSLLPICSACRCRWRCVRWLPLSACVPARAGGVRPPARSRCIYIFCLEKNFSGIKRIQKSLK